MALRIFVAAQVPPPLKEYLSALGERIRQVFPYWATQRWVPICNLHMTIYYIGELDDGRIGELVSGLDDHVSAFKAFRLPLEHPIWPCDQRRKTRILMSTFADADESYATLRSVVKNRVMDFGIEPTPEISAVLPHVTLVRSKRPLKLFDHDELLRSFHSPDVCLQFEIRSVGIYRSVHAGFYPQYTKLYEFPLLN